MSPHSPPGCRYASGLGSAACTNCSADTVSASDSAASCSSCAAGSTAAPGSTRCSLCEPGFFRGDSSTTVGCQPCPPGLVSGEGARACAECGAGSYAINATTCMPCAPGTEQVARAANEPFVSALLTGGAGWLGAAAHRNGRVLRLQARLFCVRQQCVARAAGGARSCMRLTRAHERRHGRLLAVQRGHVRGGQQIHDVPGLPCGSRWAHTGAGGV